MSYKALYRKYRPQYFSDVVGQSHIIQTLINIINLDKIGHAYLFAGPRGTGKTSVAHIFARTINCIDLHDKTKLCMNCLVCKLKNNSDIIEVDAASNNGVAEVRNIIENSKYSPSISKYKVYIIDEVHMLSKGAFNALLKTLEEPPTHVIFILATTEPHKIPVTILSRTQRFNFKRIDNRDIIKRLKFVLSKEDISYDEQSLSLIAQLAQGGMRDALSIVDNVSTYSNGKINIDEILKLFGILSNEKIIDFLNNILSGNVQEVLQTFKEAISNGHDVERLTLSFISILKDYIIYKKTLDESLLSTVNKNELSKLNLKLNNAFELLDIFVKTSSEIKSSEIPSQVLQLGLLQALSLNKDFNNINNEIIKEETKSSYEETNTLTISEENLVLNTQELESTIDNKQKELISEPESIEEKIAKTMELTLDQSVLEEVSEASEIEEEILNNNTFENTDDLNIDNLFGEPIEKEEKQKSIFSSEDIINLLVQADKNIHLENKNKWFVKDKIASYENRQIMKLLDETKLISSSNKFLLLSSENIFIVKELNKIRKTEDMLKLINKIFDKPLLIFVITKEEFSEIKSLWIKLSNERRLPMPQPIEEVKIEDNKNEEENEAEQFGKDLFGSLFK